MYSLDPKSDFHSFITGVIYKEIHLEGIISMLAKTSLVKAYKDIMF